MSYKPKTRYIVSDRGETKEILSIREASKGDLRILIRENIHTRPHESNVTLSGKPKHFPASERNKVIEQHISVHRPEKLVNHVKIKKSTNTKELSFDSSVLCDKFAFGKFVPVFSRLCGKLDLRRHSYKYDSRDQTVYLGGLDGLQETLIVTATVTPTRTASPLTLEYPWNVKSTDFLLYQFSVACCRVAMPGLNFGQTAFPYSIAPRVNGENLFDARPDTMSSMNLEETRSWIREASADIRRNALKYVAVRNFPIKDYDEYARTYDNIDFTKFLPLLPMLN